MGSDSLKPKQVFRSHIAVNQRKVAAAKEVDAMKLTRQQIHILVEQVINTKKEEVDCDEMMQVLTQYAAKLASGQSIVVSDDETILHHLALCPECREEFDMLKGIAEEGKLRQTEQELDNQ